MSTRKTLAELAADAEGREPLSIAGAPADQCPYCGCALFVNKTQQQNTRVIRYERCRNSSCGKKFVTRQQKKEFVRELGAGE